MHHRIFLRCAAAIVTVALAGAVFAATTEAAPAAAAAGVDERLSFDVTEGLNLNSFLREGPVAAHLVLRSGRAPRILIAFPAGNSGVGLWFEQTAQPVNWALQGRPQPFTDTDDRGRKLYGMRADLTVSGAPLTFRQALLSSVRVQRDYQTLGHAPSDVMSAARTNGRVVTWARDRIDGAAGYRLTVEVTHGELQGGGIEPGADGQIGLSITALSGEVPLTPLPAPSLLSGAAAPDAAARNALTFLSYREKFLAGSWRFNTYFGRDTLMSMRLLMPALTPVAVESGIGAVLTRVSAAGEVAHEEDIGESAVLEHLKAGERASDEPTFNYTMIDGSYMLAPVVRAWLLDDPRGKARAAAFLARPDGRRAGEARPFGADLMLNLHLVLSSAVAFAQDARVANLIALKEGRDSGQWRDSGEGLGRGRIPYDVNAVFMPAALTAAGDLYRSGLLDPYLGPDDRRLLTRAAAMARSWEERAPALFNVELPNARARELVAAYGGNLGVPVAAAQASLGTGTAPVRFHALALHADGTPIPIIHSDEGFALLFGKLSLPALDLATTAIMRPFPAGLLTDVGLLVANPVFAAPDVQVRFSRNAYHGTVIWSWQQAVLAAGLSRQLARTDLPGAMRQRLREAQAHLWKAIDRASEVRNSELWTWSFKDGHYRVAPFGADQADVDESNAAQLWSTVYLAIPEPVP